MKGRIFMINGSCHENLIKFFKVCQNNVFSCIRINATIISKINRIKAASHTRFKSRGFTINKKVWSFMFYIKSAHKRFR